MRTLFLAGVLVLAVSAVAEEPTSQSAEQRLQVRIHHSLSRAEAHARLSFLLRYWEERFHIQNRWSEDQVYLSGSLLGLPVEASFFVRDTDIIGDAKDPGWPLRGQVLSYVDRKLRKYLHPTYAEPP